MDKITVKKLLEELGINKPPINLNIVAKYLDIKVYFCEFDEKYNHIISFSENKEIFINKTIHPYTMHLAIAREISWIISNNKNNYKINLGLFELYSNNEELNKINKFAIDLIAPKNMLKKYMNKTTPSSLEKIFMTDFRILSMQLH